MYEVTHHTLSAQNSDCQTEGSIVTGAPYFLVDESSSAPGVIGAATCTSVDGSSCRSSGTLAYFDTPRSDGWEGDLAVATSSGTECTLSYYQYRALLQPSGDNRLEIRTYEEQGASGPCTGDEAERRGATLPCRKYEVLVGRRL
jgi:hypothetical protein